MRNPIQAVRDWSARRKYVAALHQRAVRLLPGQGIDLPEGDAVFAAAVMDLTEKHPQFLVVRTKTRLTLCKRMEFEANTSSDLKRAMQSVDALPDRAALRRHVDDLATGRLTAAPPLAPQNRCDGCGLDLNRFKHSERSQCPTVVNRPAPAIQVVAR